jgi:hypothetical protein
MSFFGSAQMAASFGYFLITFALSAADAACSGVSALLVVEPCTATTDCRGPLSAGGRACAVPPVENVVAAGFVGAVGVVACVCCVCCGAARAAGVVVGDGATRVENKRMRQRRVAPRRGQSTTTWRASVNVLSVNGLLAVRSGFAEGCLADGQRRQRRRLGAQHVAREAHTQHTGVEELLLLIGVEAALGADHRLRDPHRTRRGRLDGLRP